MVGTSPGPIRLAASDRPLIAPVCTSNNVMISALESGFSEMVCIWLGGGGISSRQCLVWVWP